MTALIAAVRLTACEEVGIGLSAIGRSSSVPVAILAIATDLLKRLVQAHRRSLHHNHIFNDIRRSQMIDVFAFATPNSVKVPIALEEMALDYTLHSINIREGGQKRSDFLALNRNAKVPVLVDHGVEGAPFALTESAAILVYLAEKTGMLLPSAGADRARVFEQLFFHASGLGVAFGNAGYFRKLAPEPVPLAIDRFGNEADRVVGVLDAVLAQHRYVAGDTLSIADIAHFGWLWRHEFAGVSLAAAPNVKRWFDGLLARPAFARGIERTMSLAPTA